MVRLYQLIDRLDKLVYRIVDVKSSPGLPELSPYGGPPVSHSREQWSDDDDMSNQETHHLGIAASGFAQWSWPFADVEEMSFAVL